MTVICHKGRIDAASHKVAAGLIWDRYPDAYRVTIIGPKPDGMWEWRAHRWHDAVSRYAKDAATPPDNHKVYEAP